MFIKKPVQGTQLSQFGIIKMNFWTWELLCHFVSESAQKQIAILVCKNNGVQAPNTW